jgi:hypothetical protein
MPITCTVGKNGQIYYFRDGKRISTQDAMKVSDPSLICDSNKKVAKAKASAKSKKVTSDKKPAKKAKSTKAVSLNSALTTVATKNNTVIESPPIVLGETFYIWDMPKKTINGDKIPFPREYVGKIVGEKLVDKALIQKLYAENKLGEKRASLYYAPLKTHEALQEMINTDTSNWDSSNWQYFYTFVYPWIVESVHPLEYYAGVRNQAAKKKVEKALIASHIFA